MRSFRNSVAMQSRPVTSGARTSSLRVATVRPNPVRPNHPGPVFRNRLDPDCPAPGTRHLPWQPREFGVEVDRQGAGSAAVPARAVGPSSSALRAADAGAQGADCSASVRLAPARHARHGESRVAFPCGVQCRCRRDRLPAVRRRGAEDTLPEDALHSGAPCGLGVCRRRVQS